MECAVCPDEFCLCHSCYDEGEVREAGGGKGLTACAQTRQRVFCFAYGTRRGYPHVHYRLSLSGECRCASLPKRILTLFCWHSVTSDPIQPCVHIARLQRNRVEPSASGSEPLKAEVRKKVTHPAVSRVLGVAPVIVVRPLNATSSHHVTGLLCVANAVRTHYFFMVLSPSGAPRG